MATLTIAVDAMGGDHAPDVVVEGLSIARERYPNIRFLVFGDKGQVAPLLARRKTLQPCCELVHTPTAVSADERPGTAMRRGRGTSMWLACESVKEGRAQAAVSAGNTGALMAIAMFILRTIPGIDRPAIASFLPTTRGETVMLDLGANVGCNARNLVEFALMGAAFAQLTQGLERPRVALLNIGTEDTKGNEEIRQAAQNLRDVGPNMPFEFTGYIEGSGICLAAADVVVCDGFSGNVALKTAEGTAKLFTTYLAAAFQHSLLSKIGYLLARPALRLLRDRLDPARYNGGALLGLNGLVVKSHGGATAVGFAAAVGIAADLAQGNLSAHIIEDLGRLAVGGVSAEAAS